jgi:caa(3)-type oxidase subunit IV
MVDAPDTQSQEPAARYTGGANKYIVIYACLLTLAALQFLIAYSNVDRLLMFLRMLLTAIAESVLALLFFMHLRAEKRGFMLFVMVITGFVLVAMQYGWTDSNRMRTGVPYSQPKSGLVSQ